MALIETAARLIAADGPRGLSLRRLTKEVGTSTMAVYTHFGGMEELQREVRREGFSRLGAHLDAVEASGDPVADLGSLGWEYYQNAIANPNLYRAMFMEGPIDEVDKNTGLDTFERLVACVGRCIDAGRFDSGDPTAWATQLWAINHGIVTLQFANLLSPEQAVQSLTAAAVNLFRAYGDDPRATGRSMVRTRERLSAHAGSGQAGGLS